MRIHSTRFKKIAADKGMSAETLADAVVRTGLPKSKAASAVGNWMRGADHPRCKAADIKALAGALGVEVAEIAKFSCTFRYHRGSPRKAALLAQLIRGKDIITAENLLNFNIKRAAVDVREALDAARADAEQANADVGALVVCESTVDEGPIIKRFQPKDRGRAHSIHKRMAHIKISLEQRV